MRFELAVTNNPVCVPARSCLLTGQCRRTCTGHLGNCATDPSCRERLRLTDPALPEVLRANGYRTALVGKWHVHLHPLLVGFDQALFPLIPRRNYGQVYFEGWEDGFRVQQFAPEFEMAQVRRFLRGWDGGPFLLFYSISPLRPNTRREGRLAHAPEWFKIYTIWDYFWCKYELRSDALPPGYDLRALTARHYGMITCVDELVGELLRVLESRRPVRDTLLVFLSDHGDDLGSHHRFNKNSLFEESVRVPMILWWPERLQPRVNAGHVAHSVDVMPSVVGLCGLEVPGTVQGRNLAPMLSGSQETLGSNVGFIELGGPPIGIRGPTHLLWMKLMPDGQGIQDVEACFYDLREDPYQQRNLTCSGEQEHVARQLRERLSKWHTSTPWRVVKGLEAWVHPPCRVL